MWSSSNFLRGQKLVLWQTVLYKQNFTDYIITVFTHEWEHSPGMCYYFRYVTSNTKIQKRRAWNCFNKQIFTNFVEKQQTYIGSPLFSFLLYKIEWRHILQVYYCACAVMRNGRNTDVQKLPGASEQLLSLQPSIIYIASRWTKVHQRYELKDTSLVCVILCRDQTFV